VSITTLASFYTLDESWVL